MYSTEMNNRLLIIKLCYYVTIERQQPGHDRIKIQSNECMVDLKYGYYTNEDDYNTNTRIRMQTKKLNFYLQVI